MSRTVFIGVFLLLCASTGCASGDEGSGSSARGGAPGTSGADGSAGASAGDEGGVGGDSGSGASGSGSSGAGGSDGPKADTCSADEEACGDGDACRFGFCVPEPAECETGDDCWTDSYCSDDGECIPFGVPEDHVIDSSCGVDIDIDALVPEVQCRWTGPPVGDDHMAFNQAMATPAVVDFNVDEDPRTLHPSIVFPSFDVPGGYTAAGYLRVIDGETCDQQFSFPEQIHPPSPPAVGDIDGDDRPDIIAMAHGGGLYAWGYDDGAGDFVQMWRSATCADGMRTPDTTGGTTWAGPSIHDLDDDGSPEIVFGASVYDAEGCLLSNTLGFPFQAYIPVIADVDEDGKMELIQGNAIHEWDAGAGEWVDEAYFAGGVPAGQVAVAEFGNNPLSSMGDEDRPEIVVIDPGGGNGTAYVMTIEGTILFGPIAIPGGGQGGAPTVADFDGDGRREFATAGGARYVVFDFDCLGAPAECEADGVLWTQPSQDQSSNVTGSSVFDFDADGAAEAVYADECFLRIYDGATGDVVYSAPRSSGTTFENPVIADVDGDFHTEIVSTVNDYADLCPAGPDTLFPSDPFVKNHGVVVLRDEMDRWAASRPIWNQHAYAVTHVTDDGRIPKTSEVKKNWKDDTLNNFRQNTQGDLDSLGIQDLTVSGNVREVECDGSTAVLEAEICNRGTLPMASGTVVSFRKDKEDGKELCSVPIATILGVAECDRVSCEADLPSKEAIDMYVKVDPEDDEAECWEGNNFSVFRDVECGKVPVVD